MKPHRWHLPYYKSFISSVIIATLCLHSFQIHALNWTVVTSEEDSGLGTLRNAIDLVNSGGGIPDAIAFANNVHTIFLQSNLPPILNPVVIDGLATVSNGSVIQEGNCELVPSPVDDPQGFSANLRITIDGSTIPDTVDPNTRWGLNIQLNLQDNSIIRGIHIKNITTPASKSVAAGIIFFTIEGIDYLVECCEIDQIHNAANISEEDSSDNKSVGIYNITLDQGKSTVLKSYIHNIESDSIISCENVDDTLETGSAYGTINCQTIDTCRIECITSGSINVSCNNSLRAIIGRSVGVANTANVFANLPSWPCSVIGREGRNKTGVENCPIACNQEGSENTICIQNNLIRNVCGGSAHTSQPEIFLTEVAGILIGSPFDLQPEIFPTEVTNILFDLPFDAIRLGLNVLIQNNIICSVKSGTVTASGDEITSIALGSFGAVFSKFFDPDINNVVNNCNTVKSIASGSTTVEGENSTAFVGYTYGLWNQINGSNTSIISTECNTISNICGATGTAAGTCSRINDNIEMVCNVFATKHTPGGAKCAKNQPPLVAGIVTEVLRANTAITNNNKIEKVNGGKRCAQGSQSSIVATGTAGIYVTSSASTSNNNSIQSIFGTKLITQLGSLSAIKQEGTAGLCIIGNEVTAIGNHVALVCEGHIRAAQNTLAANLTQIFFGLLVDTFRTPITKQLDFDTALPYAPVITSGVVIGGLEPTIELSRNCTQQDRWCISDNSIDTIIGSAVTGGMQPVGSIAVGVWLEPPLIAQQFIGQEKNVRSFESCATFLLLNSTNEAACHNTINNITGGTNVPAYGILLDGSTQFFTSSTSDENKTSSFFTLDQNRITNICGSKMLPVFEVDLSAIIGLCPEIIESADLERTAFPFLPFEPTSGIYTLFGGCSTLSNNTIKEVKAFNTDARGITTTASSDMLIFGNSCSEIQGYGIFVGGAIATIDAIEDLEASDLSFEIFASVRNKIHTNKTFDNTNKGIKLGLVDWSNALFGLERLNVCPDRTGETLFSQYRYNAETIPEDSVAIFGNHGQPEPHITKVICNSNGTITADISLKGTHRLTNFTVQFFRNSTSLIPHGEQAISDFDDPLFVFTTDFYGNAHKRFTFIPLANIQSGNTITAHITVNDLGQSAITDTYFCDTSEFGGQTSAPCQPKVLSQQSNSKPPPASGFAALLHR